MTKTVQIIGYTEEGHCDHCGRALRHCIQIDDGRTVGATCLGKKLTAPKVYNGKQYRMDATSIIHTAKVVARRPQNRWYDFGVSDQMVAFELI